MEKILQISSGDGPAECERVVALLLSKILKAAKNENVDINILETKPGSLPGTYYSATLLVSGKLSDDFCEQWRGTILWVAQSPYRRFHKRKNWFVSVNLFDVGNQLTWSLSDITFQTMRSSGPGGQNVNKVESSVRAIHLPTGISVTANEHRSQILNKKLAIDKLKTKVFDKQIDLLNEMIKIQWLEHKKLERGNAKIVFKERL